MSDWMRPASDAWEVATYGEHPHDISLHVEDLYPDDEAEPSTVWLHLTRDDALHLADELIAAARRVAVTNA